jgi:hypothetical protein
MAFFGLKSSNTALSSMMRKLQAAGEVDEPEKSPEPTATITSDHPTQPTEAPSKKVPLLQFKQEQHLPCG